jgi:hypothetical protein
MWRIEERLENPLFCRVLMKYLASTEHFFSLLGTFCAIRYQYDDILKLGKLG